MAELPAGDMDQVLTERSARRGHIMSGEHRRSIIGVIRVQRGSQQPFKCKGIAVHVRTLLEVDVPGQRLHVHHVRVGGLRKSRMTNAPIVPACAPAR